MINILKKQNIARIVQGIVLLQMCNILFAAEPNITQTPDVSAQDRPKIAVTIVNGVDVNAKKVAEEKKDTLLEDLTKEKEVHDQAMSYLKNKNGEFPNLSDTQKKMFQEGFDRCTNAIHQKLKSEVEKKLTLVDKRNILQNKLIFEKSKAALYYYKWLKYNNELYKDVPSLDKDLLSPLRLSFFENDLKDLNSDSFQRTFRAIQRLSPPVSKNDLGSYHDLLSKLDKKNIKITTLSELQLKSLVLSDKDKDFLLNNSLQKGDSQTPLYQTLLEELKALDIDKEMISKENALEEKKDLLERSHTVLKTYQDEKVKIEAKEKELETKLSDTSLNEEDKVKYTEEKEANALRKKELDLLAKSIPEKIMALEKEIKKIEESKIDLQQLYHDKIKELSDSIIEKQNDLENIDKELLIISNESKDIDLSNQKDKEEYIKSLLESNPFCQLLKVDYGSLNNLCKNDLFQILDSNNQNNIAAMALALNKTYSPENKSEKVIPNDSKKIEVPKEEKAPEPVETPAAEATTPTDEVATPDAEKAADADEDDEKNTNLFKLVCISGCSRVSCGVDSSENKKNDEDENEEDENADVTLELKFTDKDKESLYRYSLDWKCEDEACSLGDTVLKKEFINVEEGLSVFVVSKKDDEEITSNTCTIKESKIDEIDEPYDPFLNPSGNGTIQHAQNTPPQNMNQYPSPLQNMSISVLINIGFT